jgi:hypothetical protein
LPKHEIFWFRILPCSNLYILKNKTFECYLFYSKIRRNILILIISRGLDWHGVPLRVDWGPTATEVDAEWSKFRIYGQILKIFLFHA